MKMRADYRWYHWVLMGTIVIAGLCVKYWLWKHNYYGVDGWRN